MIHKRSKKLAFGALALSFVLAFQTIPPTQTTNASDHIDSPIITQDRGSDLTDTFAFLDPNDNSKVALIMSTQGFIVSGEHFGMAIFDNNIRYRFEIENTGDAKPDTFVDVYYSKGLGRVTPQTATIELPNGKKFTAPTTVSNQEYKAPPPVITTDPASGVTFYGGNADDPFFLDDTGANRMIASAIMNPGRPNTALLSERGGRDTYAGFNTMITAVSIPASMLRGKSGNVIGINAVTQRRERQRIGDNNVVTGEGDWKTVDRDGVPAVNNGLIPPPRKDEYNAASTEDDAKGRFKDDIIKSLKAFNTDDAHIAMLAKIAVEKGDILRLDLTVPNKGAGGGNNKDGGYGKMGGRRLQDDVMDMTFTIVNNGKPLGDKVDRNEVPFRNQFPFVADPTQPFPPGKNPDDHTRQ
ncbi:MAG: DUF4331 domain-containing protein [Acidobacteriota bacterium]|nr:DUF4331 domain-containing protein [Acidobacteriota bacterium]